MSIDPTPQIDRLQQELWQIFRDNSDSSFFISVKGLVALPPPEARQLLGNNYSTRDDKIPEPEKLNEYVGILIATNKDAFDTNLLPESINNYKLNPTEYTARLVAYSLQTLRDIICGKKDVIVSEVSTKIVTSLAALITPLFAVANKDAALGIAALLALVPLSMLRGDSAPRRMRK